MLLNHARALRTAAAITATLLTLSLSACSGDSDQESPETETTSASEQESVDPAKVSPADLPKIPAVAQEKGAIQALTLGECAVESGKQTVEGEITSSAKKAADYLVTVSWTTGAGDVMGRGFAVLQDVEPGATETFTITAKVAEGATQCVPGVSYGTIK